MSHSNRRCRQWTLFFAISATALSGCASSSSEGVDGAESCVRRIAFDNETYTDTSAKNIPPKEILGGNPTSTPLLSCDDGSDETPATEAEMVNVYRINSLDPALAIAVGSSVDDTVLFVPENVIDEIPPEVQEFIDELRPQQ